MSNRGTQTSLSTTDYESARESASVRTLFGEDNADNASSAMESSRGYVNGHNDAILNGKENIIVSWSGPNDPVWHSSLGTSIILLVSL